MIARIVRPVREPVTWHLLSGEFPPDCGGVGDHTARLAEALYRRGHRTVVWTGRHARAVPVSKTSSFELRAVVERWHGAGLKALECALDAEPVPRRLLLQYSPNAFGCRGANLALTRWLGARRRAGEQLWVMVHEPFYPWRVFDKPTRWILSATQRTMLRDLVRRADRLLVATPKWEAPLRKMFGGPLPESPVWIPSFATVEVISAPDEIAVLRRHSDDGGRRIGVFGTLGGNLARRIDLLAHSVLTANPRHRLVLIGRGSTALATRLQHQHPELARRVHASGPQPAERLSLWLQSCDLFVQPCPGGANARRSSLTTVLAHARPLVTEAGSLTESLWQNQAGVYLVPESPTGEPLAVAALAWAAETDQSLRERADAALALYRRTLSLDFALHNLLSEATGISTESE